MITPHSACYPCGEPLRPERKRERLRARGLEPQFEEMVCDSPVQIDQVIESVAIDGEQASGDVGTGLRCAGSLR
jgi:hypothetical protein